MGKLSVIVGASIVVYGLDDEEKSKLATSMARQDPGAMARAERLRQPKLSTKTWSPVQWTRDDGVMLPRGAMADLRAWAKLNGHELVTENKMSGTKAPPPDGVTYGAVTLRAYQRTVRDALLTKVQGVAVMPCGSGKTTTVIAAAVSVRGPKLILAPTIDIVEQFASQIKVMVPGATVRLIATGHRDAGHPPTGDEWIVSTVQSMVAVDPDVLSRFTVVVYDEAHMMGETAMEVLGACTAMYRWAITATPDRPDGWGFLLDVLFGARLATITTAELIARGAVQQPCIVPLYTGLGSDDLKDSHKWLLTCDACERVVEANPLPAEDAACPSKRCKGKLLVATAKKDSWIPAKTIGDVSKNTERQALIATLCEAGVRAGRQVMVLVALKETARDVHNLCLHTHRLRSAVLTSGVSGRSDILARFKGGALNVIVCTSLADMGLDAPNINMVILAAPSKGGGRSIQRVGRACRPCSDGREPIIIDLVDKHPNLVWWWSTRRAVFRAEYGKTSVLDPKERTDLSAMLDFIRSR